MPHKSQPVTGTKKRMFLIVSVLTSIVFTSRLEAGDDIRPYFMDILTEPNQSVKKLTSRVADYTKSHTLSNAEIHAFQDILAEYGLEMRSNLGPYGGKPYSPHGHIYQINGPRVLGEQGGKLHIGLTWENLTDPSLRLKFNEVEMKAVTEIVGQTRKARTALQVGKKAQPKLSCRKPPSCTKLSFGKAFGLAGLSALIGIATERGCYYALDVESRDLTQLENALRDFTFMVNPGLGAISDGIGAAGDTVLDNAYNVDQEEHLNEAYILDGLNQAGVPFF